MIECFCLCTADTHSSRPVAKDSPKASHPYEGGSPITERHLLLSSFAKLPRAVLPAFSQASGIGVVSMGLLLGLAHSLHAERSSERLNQTEQVASALQQDVKTDQKASPYSITHERRALLNTIADTEGDSAERRKAWDRFYHDVKSHAAAEEETFYSTLMSETWGQDHARHSVHEHQQLDDIMEELRETDMSSSAWLTRFKQLKHDYEHHMDEEEDELFTRAKKVIGEEHNDAFGDKFLKRKEKEAKLIEEKRKDSLED